MQRRLAMGCFSILGFLAIALTATGQEIDSSFVPRTELDPPLLLEPLPFLRPLPLLQPLLAPRLEPTMAPSTTWTELETAAFPNHPLRLASHVEAAPASQATGTDEADDGFRTLGDGPADRPAADADDAPEDNVHEDGAPENGAAENGDHVDNGHEENGPPAHVVQDKADPLPLARLHHLHQAADHLEAAGLPSEAKLVRQRAIREERRADEIRLAAKLAQLSRLQEEIEQLRDRLATNNQLMLRFQLVSIPAEHWETVQKTLSERASSHKNEQATTVIDSTELSALVKEWLQAKQGKLIAEPSVITVDNRPVSFFSGERYFTRDSSNGPKSLRAEQAGLGLEARPRLLSSGGLELEVAIEWSQHNHQTQRTQLMLKHAATGQLKAGQSLVLLLQNKDASERPALLSVSHDQITIDPLLRTADYWAE
ncbi:type II and III secretion system protein [Lignipirellula cremea]|uniref:Bacterial type II and III secretion system protein n=1 Tax=Lignipirellula cremea TaxID=2528010 RepID=A0A518DQA5_9BACT|nr:type II and III secretion system protein [Lignipirellula cremea]QDU94002.1 Bacterial type II and III secretion system protein [Lignipirellula cremea]